MIGKKVVQINNVLEGSIQHCNGNNTLSVTSTLLNYFFSKRFEERERERERERKRKREIEKERERERFCLSQIQVCRRGRAASGD